MPDIEEAFGLASHLVESSQIDQDLFDGLDLSQVVLSIAALINTDLETIKLDEDPEAVSRIIQQFMQTVGFKAFVAGYLLSPSEEESIKIQIPQEALQQIGLAIIKNDSVAFSLYSEDE